MKAGDAIPVRVHEAEARQMAVLAEILRDPNPIHLDSRAAAAAGLGDRVINQGPANLAYVMDLLSETFPGFRLGAIESRYLGNVRAGDRVEAGGVVVLCDEGRIVCDAWLKLPDGARAVAVRATLLRRAG